MDPVTLIVLMLATWRLSTMFVNERGPGRMFQNIRELAGIEHDEVGKPTIIPDGFFSELLSCVWCTSVWVGTFWVLLYTMLPLVGFWFGCIFAFSAGAIAVERWMG